MRGLALALAIALAVAACGGDGDAEGTADEDVVSGDLIDQGGIELDADAVTTTTPSATDSGSATAAEGVGDDASGSDGDAGAEPAESDDTIPQEEQSADQRFFDSVGVFMSCMDAEAGGFIGIPSGGENADPTLPVNQPDYIEALQSCAARSDIINTMEDAEDSGRFTQEEIEERNRNFVAFRECMIGRGWHIPEPSPDENGLLFHSYVAAAQEWVAPEGQSILDSDDLGECGTEANPLGDDTISIPSTSEEEP